MNWLATQQALAAKGYSPGALDGVPGPATYAALFAFVGSKASPETAALGRGAAQHFPKAGINTPLRLAHFLAQGAIETGGYRKFVENLNYSAGRLTEVWPSRFPDLKSAREYAFNPEALAEKSYGGRLGNVNPGDGWKYRGRGLTMLTGRANYAEAQDVTGLPLIEQPDLAALPETSVEIMCGYWTKRNINRFADADDLRGVRKAINGGTIGIEAARAYLSLAKQVLR